MNVWVSECVSEWAIECVSLWMYERVSECIFLRVNKWVSAWVCEWVCECVSEWACECVLIGGGFIFQKKGGGILNVKKSTNTHSKEFGWICLFTNSATNNLYNRVINL